MSINKLSSKELIIRGKWILTMSDQGDIKDGAIHILKGKIKNVSSYSDLEQKLPDLEIVGDGTGIVIPGLINAHTHFSEAFIPGMGSEMTLFEWLKSVCYFLAKHPNDSFTPPPPPPPLGRHDSSLAAFIGGDRTPASMRGYATEPVKLQGWRCLQCGQSEVTDRDIEYLMAQDLIPTWCSRRAVPKL